MKFDQQAQQSVAQLITDSLGCQLVGFKGRLAIPDNGQYPSRRADAKADAHQLEMRLGVKDTMPPATTALLFNAVPDRVYHKNFGAIDGAVLQLIERVNAFIQDRMAEPTDGEISCMLYLPEIDKQPDAFPLQFALVGDFYF